ncbi:ABC transporter G family member 17 [Cucumispora dikerogammari]|nr:ABC transporter G family member 17 [Cucumispora dikerogammari]
MYTFTNIEHKIKNYTVLDKITINIPDKKITMILGPSGAGKTTLLKLISGRFYNKHLKLNDRSILSKDLNKQTAFVYQHHNIPGEMTVNEYFNFTYNCKNSTLGNKASQDEIDELLKMLNIYDLKDRIMGHMGVNLSGGQLKRLELGLELITESELLLIDEPLSGLDSFNSTMLMDVLKKFNRTIVLSIHHPSSSILEYTDHIIILNKARIFFEGTCAELIQYIRELDYNYNEADKKNCCEFVFNSILPQLDTKQNVIKRFVYKKNEVLDKNVFIQKANKTPSSTMFFFTVLNLLRRSFLLFYRHYISATIRVLLPIVACSLFIYNYKTGFKGDLDKLLNESGYINCNAH